MVLVVSVVVDSDRVVDVGVDSTTDFHHLDLVMAEFTTLLTKLLHNVQETIFGRFTLESLHFVLELSLVAIETHFVSNVVEMYNHSLKFGTGISHFRPCL